MSALTERGRGLAIVARDREGDQFGGIGAVERETGILKETLRMWERRYGFPRPQRAASGERFYSVADVAKLRVLKQLLDKGHRPGAIIRKSQAELEALMDPAFPGLGSVPPRAPSIAAGLDLLRADRLAEFHHWLRMALLARGLRGFALEIMRPLAEAVGTGWRCGDLCVYQEHFFTETLQRVLRGALDMAPPAEGGPRVLLTTLPGEGHMLGLLMLEALLTADGVGCLALGAQTPPEQIVLCARRERIDVVALSFSAGFPPRAVRTALRELAELLGPGVEIWAGGAGSGPRGDTDGIHVAAGLEEAVTLLERWRARNEHGA